MRFPILPDSGPEADDFSTLRYDRVTKRWVPGPIVDPASVAAMDEVIDQFQATMDATDTGVATVLRGTGQATAALAATTAPRLPGPGRGQVVIMWDDGYKEVWDDLRPMLLARPWQRHAFAINPGSLDTDPGIMTSAQVATLAAEGHEICSHAYTVNPHIRDLPPAERAFEYDASQAALETITGKPCTTFVYPNGTNSRSYLTDREMYLRYGRVMSNVAGLPFTTPGRTGHYVRRYLWNPTTHATVLSAIRAARENGLTLCLSAHKPGGAGDLSLAQIAEALDLIDAIDVRTVLPFEAYPSPAARLINPGFEEGLAGWEIAKSGNGAGEVVKKAPTPGMPGTKAMRLYASGTSTSDWAYAFQKVPVVPGVTYTFAAAMTGTRTGTGAHPALRSQPEGWDPSGSNPSTVTGPTLEATTAWQPISMDYVVPDNVAMLRLDLRLPPAHGGEVFYDRVAFGPKELGVFV